MLVGRAVLALLGFVTVATVSVTPVTAQTPCYLPDGKMHIGVQRPADCSPVRPKTREEVIERNRELGAKLARQRASDDATEAAARREALIQAEVSQRVMGSQLMKMEASQAERAIRVCDVYKHGPQLMNAEQSALCYRVWADKANRTLAR